MLQVHAQQNESTDCAFAASKDYKVQPGSRGPFALSKDKNSASTTRNTDTPPGFKSSGKPAISRAPSIPDLGTGIQDTAWSHASSQAHTNQPENRAARSQPTLSLGLRHPTHHPRGQEPAQRGGCSHLTLFPRKGGVKLYPKGMTFPAHQASLPGTQRMDGCRQQKPGRAQRRF